jgi:hypothetical protein
VSKLGQGQPPEAGPIQVAETVPVVYWIGGLCAVARGKSRLSAGVWDAAVIRLKGGDTPPTETWTIRTFWLIVLSILTADR